MSVPRWPATDAANRHGTARGNAHVARSDVHADGSGEQLEVRDLPGRARRTARRGRTPARARSLPRSHAIRRAGSRADRRSRDRFTAPRRAAADWITSGANAESGCPRCCSSTAVTTASSSSGHRSSTNRAIWRSPGRVRSGHAMMASVASIRTEGERRKREDGAVGQRQPPLRERRRGGDQRDGGQRARRDAQREQGHPAPANRLQRLCQVHHRDPTKASTTSRGEHQHQPVAPVVLLPLGLLRQADHARLRGAGRTRHQFLKLHGRDALHGALTRIDVDGQRPVPGGRISRPALSSVEGSPAGGPARGAAPRRPAHPPLHT